MLETAANENKEIIIMGDFNINYELDIDLNANPINLIENMFALRQLINVPILE